MFSLSDRFLFTMLLLSYFSLKFMSLLKSCLPKHHSHITNIIVLISIVLIPHHIPNFKFLVLTYVFPLYTLILTVLMSFANPNLLKALNHFDCLPFNARCWLSLLWFQMCWWVLPIPIYSNLWITLIIWTVHFDSLIMFCIVGSCSICMPIQ